MKLETKEQKWRQEKVSSIILCSKAWRMKDAPHLTPYKFGVLFI